MTHVPHQGTEDEDAMRTGKITQVLGAVIDVEFPDGYLPPIYNAIKVSNKAIDDREIIIFE